MIKMPKKPPNATTMKKYLIYTLIAFIILTAAFGPLGIKEAAAGDCLDVTPPSVGFNIEACVAGLANIILTLVGTILYLAGILLNFVFKQSVIDMTEFINNISAIEKGWTIFRDLANMFFIFILVYIAILTILRLSSHNTKALLIRLIVAALMINFSLFFTKVVIDASNIIAIEFYDKITINGVSLGSENAPLDAGLSAAFMSPLKLTSFYSKGEKGMTVETATVGKSITVMVLGSIFLLIAAFSFFTVSILFAIRFAVLILLMVLSPFAFAGMILPQMQKISSQWWNTLFSQAFFAPVYIMLTWFVLSIIVDKNFLGASSGHTFTDAIRDGSMPATAVIFNFLIVIIFLIASIIIAKDMASKGGVAVQAAANKGTAFMGGLFTRNLIRLGRGAGQTMAYAGQAAAKGVQAAGRRIPLVSTAASGLGRLAATKPGKVAGRVTKFAAEQTLRPFKKGWGALERLKLPGYINKSYYDVTTAARREAKKEAEEKKKEKRERSLERNKRDLRTAISRKDTATIQTIIRGMPISDIKELDPAILTHELVRPYLTPAQIDAAQREGTLTPAQIELIQNRGLDTATPAEAAVIMSGMTNEEITRVNGDTLGRNAVARHLTHSQLDALHRSNKLTTAQKARIKWHIMNIGKTCPGYSYMAGPAGVMW
jgi:hypothetical protein